LNKGGGTEALMRVLGSMAFVAAARVVFLVVGEKGTERVLFIPMKSNISAPRPGLAYRKVQKMTPSGIEAPAIEWELGRNRQDRGRSVS
jgi:putative DNA primase/helicase